jgi:ABC-type bacteriocin/lantibiotic exporter with double-glycine peptidase domain
MSAFAQEHLSAARMLAAYSQERPTITAFDRVSGGYAQENIRYVLLSNAIIPLPNLVDRLAATLVLAIGGGLIIKHQLSVEFCASNLGNSNFTSILITVFILKYSCTSFMLLFI